MCVAYWMFEMKIQFSSLKKSLENFGLSKFIFCSARYFISLLQSQSEYWTSTVFKWLECIIIWWLVIQMAYQCRINSLERLFLEEFLDLNVWLGSWVQQQYSCFPVWDLLLVKSIWGSRNRFGYRLYSISVFRCGCLWWMTNWVLLM